MILIPIKFTDGIAAKINKLINLRGNFKIVINNISNYDKSHTVYVLYDM